MSRPTRSAREVVELYNHVMWNERDFDLADELYADTVVRHEVGEVVTLTRAQAKQRVYDMWAMFDTLRFDLNVVVAGKDNEHVTIVYQTTMTTKEGEDLAVASIEVFRVVDGRITEVYNCGYKQGFWK